MRIRPLTPKFGMEIFDLTLSEVTEATEFPEIRRLFEEHSVLLFRNQKVNELQHLKFGQLFGPIEDRLVDEREPGDTYKIPKVSNVREDGSIIDELDEHALHLKANFQWHADSTFMPSPALTNILIAKLVTSSGGETELASTRVSWSVMPTKLKESIRGRGIWHRYAHSRAKVDPNLAKLSMFHKWKDQHWKSVWTNPVNGQEALYIASHAYKVDGYSSAQSELLISDLIEFCTQPHFVYSHRWKVGDVLLWDQRAVLHRGRPWPYREPRTLSSICISTTETDGLEQMRLST